jgi:hypothetical protein
VGLVSFLRLEYKGDMNDTVAIVMNEYIRSLDSPHLRKGQALMNALYGHVPEFYRKVSGTDLDCFYDDSKFDACLAAFCLQYGD